MSPWLSDLFLSSQSDDRLVRLARDGHQEAFAVIVERYRRELARFAGRLCADGRAEDLVQQTFLSAFSALQDGSQVKHLRGWLYAILRNHAVRTSARIQPQTEISETTAAGDPLEDSIGQRMFALEALAEIKALPERQRTALVATALEGRSRSEVAGLLGLSEGAVRQLVHRARSAVRTAVTAITPFPLLRWFVTRGKAPDRSTAELIAGAGGASGAAAAVKLGAVVAVGLGVAGVVAVRPQLSHQHRASGHRAIAPPRGSGHELTAAPSVPAEVRLGTPAAGGTAALAGIGASAVQVALAGTGPGQLRAARGLAPREDGGHDTSGGDGGRGSSSSGSDGGDHGGSGGGGSSDGGGSSGSGSSTATSGTSDGGSGGDGGSSGSDGGAVASSSGSTTSDGGGGSTSGSGSSTSGSGSSDGGSSSSNSSDGGILSGGSLDGHDGGGSTVDGSSSSGGSSG